MRYKTNEEFVSPEEIDIKETGISGLLEDIVRIMKEQKKTAWRISKFTGLKVDTVKNIERGGNIRLDNVIKILACLGYKLTIQKLTQENED